MNHEPFDSDSAPGRLELPKDQIGLYHCAVRNSVGKGPPCHILVDFQSLGNKEIKVFTSKRKHEFIFVRCIFFLIFHPHSRPELPAENVFWCGGRGYSLKLGDNLFQ